MRAIPFMFPVAVAVALLLVSSSAYAQEQPDPPRPPIVQLCAATDIDVVDDLLAQLSTEDLVEQLAPLATLTVPDDPRGLRLRGDVQVDDVRDALGCSAITPTSEPPAPTGRPTPTTPPTSPSVSPSVSAPVTPLPDPGSALPGFSQLTDVPSVAADTGGGPA